jgi:ribosomal subunit interface protein
MQIQINAADLSTTDALWTFINKEVAHELRHHADQLTRVEVHLHDLNSKQKAGNDKRVIMEARPRGHQPIVAQDESSDIYEAVKGAARKLERALTHKLERIGDKRMGESARPTQPFEGA